MKNHALQAKLSEMESKLLGGKHWMRFVHVVPDADCRFQFVLFWLRPGSKHCGGVAQSAVERSFGNSR